MRLRSWLAVSSVLILVLFGAMLLSYFRPGVELRFRAPGDAAKPVMAPSVLRAPSPEAQQASKPLESSAPLVDAAPARDSEFVAGEAFTIGSEGYGPHIERAWRDGGARQAAEAAEVLSSCGNSANTLKAAYSLPDSSGKSGFVELMEAEARRCQTVTAAMQQLEQQLWARAAQGRQAAAAARNWTCLAHPKNPCSLGDPVAPEVKSQAVTLMQQALDFGDRKALEAAASHSGKALFADPVLWRAHQLAVAELDRREGRKPTQSIEFEYGGMRMRTATAHEFLLHKNLGFSADDEARAAALSKAIVDRFPPAKRP